MSEHQRAIAWLERVQRDVQSIQNEIRDMESKAGKILSEIDSYDARLYARLLARGMARLKAAQLRLLEVSS